MAGYLRQHIILYQISLPDGSQKVMCPARNMLSTFDQTIQSSSHIKVLRAGVVRQVSYIIEVAMQGTIKRLVREKGFGFIRCSDGQEVFFHRTGLQQMDFDGLQEGTAVELDVEQSAKGPRATNVRLSTMA